jgi:hypothetical protein
MANNFLLLSTVGAIGWIFLSGPPEMKPVREPSRAAAASASSYVGARPSSGIEARQAPVPLVRSVRVTPPATAASAATAPAVSAETPVATGEQDDLDRRAAKAAAEEDGYKRVTIIGKASNGAWRVRGLRGTTEVLLTVDGTGRVSMD